MMHNNGSALITGGAGFLGSAVARQLLDEGLEIALYDSFVVYAKPDGQQPPFDFSARLKPLLKQVKLIRGNTLDRDYLRRAMHEIRPSVVIHMAAMPLAALAIEHTEEAYQTICTSTHNLLEIMRDVDWPCRLLYVSSSMVYGDFLNNEVEEDTHPTSPKDVYGAFKLAGEIIAKAYLRNYGVDVVMVRPSAVYGPFDSNSRVIRKFINAAMQGQPLTIDGDGSMKMDFTFVDDTARAIALAAITPGVAGEIFNVTRGEGRSLKDLAEIVISHFPGTEIIHRPKPAYVPERGALSVEKARRLLGYMPAVSLEEGVGRYVSHLRAHAF